MNEPPTEDLHERALAHAMGWLDERSAREFADALAARRSPHVRAWRDTLRDLSTLALATAPVTPPAGARARLLSRISEQRISEQRIVERRAPARESRQIWKSWVPKEPSSSSRVLTSDEGRFERTGFAGVTVRQLGVDAARKRVTMLVRMEPGSSYPGHRHADAEECFVLEGDLRTGDAVMHTGDYQRVEAGSVHGVQSTEEGCLLLIHSSQDDELLG